eukprot:CAMPEP_0173169258 /NCGR_PEP_ID=MMETSP1141-20130122/605_1 /TAXON_ID=483371 /ORGANISM="non described non described, Strain CCMP2298" /LENGTH=54 /DNA_ID=CAMNT_0014091067 /DNA_START=237 /DNA_END=401 /DNA_ORIENTATION=-
MLPRRGDLRVRGNPDLTSYRGARSTAAPLRGRLHHSLAGGVLRGGRQLRVVGSP